MVLSLNRSLIADIASMIVNSQAPIVEQHPGTGLACWVQKTHFPLFQNSEIFLKGGAQTKEVLSAL